MANYHNKAGYIFERRSLNRDIFFLLSIFGGSGWLAELSKDGDYDMATELKVAFQVYEVHRLLVSIAVHLRIMHDNATIIDENHPDFDIMGHYDFRKDIESIGHWSEASGSLKLQPLYFREACNKIIHANKIDIKEESFGGDNWRQRLVPEITLRGTHRGVEWQALVDIERFARGAYCFTSIDPYEGV